MKFRIIALTGQKWHHTCTPLSSLYCYVDYVALKQMMNRDRLSAEIKQHEVCTSLTAGLAPQHTNSPTTLSFTLSTQYSDS